MRALLKAEWYQLKKDKRNLFSVVASVAIGSILLFDGDISSGSDALYRTLYNMPLLFILINIFVALYMGENFSERHIHRTIAAGHGRRESVYVYGLISILFSNFILMFQPVVTVILFSTVQGWGHLYSISEGVLILLITVLLNSSFISLIVFLAFLLKKPGSILVASTALYFFIIFLLNSPQAPMVAHILPLGQSRLLIEHGTTAVQSATVALAYSIIFLCLTVKYFKHCDLK